MIDNAVWITWENQRRNREICNALKIKLYELDTIDLIRNPVKKYLFGAFLTFKIFFKEKPKIIFCQNPSLVLSLLSILYGKFFAVRIIVDAHNAGLFPLDDRSRFLSAVSEFIQCHADLTIVTNSELSRHVETNGGKAFVLQDPIPRIPKIKKRKLNGNINILFICSFAGDEPYEIVFEAAQHLDPTVSIYVSGNYRKRGIDPSICPQNISLMGYISEDEYIEMLHSVDATIDLTTRENCLVCGAYESVATGKPMILSRTNALMSYFFMGAIYTENSCFSMVKAIETIVKKIDLLSREIAQLKLDLVRDWDQKKLRLEKILRSY